MYDREMNLSENFKLKEFTDSATAAIKKIENHANLSEKNLYNLKALCQNVLQPLRDHFKEPVYVNSGFRCAALNKAVKGAKTSQHMYGEAADIEARVLKIQNPQKTTEWFEWMRDNLVYDQLILEIRIAGKYIRKWIHVSYKATGPNRQQVLTLYK